MKKKRFRQEEIIKALKEGEAGGVAREIVRRMGITETTFYRWRQKYAAWR